MAEARSRLEARRLPLGRPHEFTHWGDDKEVKESQGVFQAAIGREAGYSLLIIEEEARKIRADPLTRIFARHMEVELRDTGNVQASDGTSVKFDKKEREVMRNKTPDVCVEVFRLALALHMRHRFTRVQAVDLSLIHI